MGDDELLVEAHGALRTYGMHKYLCASRATKLNDRKRNACDCGLGEIVRKLSARIRAEDQPDE